MQPVASNKNNILNPPPTNSNSVNPAPPSSIQAPGPATTALTDRAATDITGQVAKKKKKHKKPKDSAAKSLQTLAQNNSGVSSAQASAILSLVPSSSARSQPVHLGSIFENQGFSELNGKERQMLLDMFQRWPLSKNVCLLDIFGTDLMIHWNVLIKSNPQLGADLTEIKETLFYQFFMSFTHLLGRAMEHEDPAYLTALTCNKFFKSEREMVEVLGNAVKSLEHLQAKLASPASATSGKGGGKMQEFLRKKNEGISAEIGGLKDKIFLLLKFYRSPHANIVLVNEGLGSYRESVVLDRACKERLPCMIQMMHYITEVIDTGLKHGVVGVGTAFFRKFHLILLDMSSKGISKSNVQAFNTCYIECSLSMAKNKSKYQRCLQKAIQDPSFTYERYCQTIGIPCGAVFTQKETIAQIYNTLAACDLIDLWIYEYESIIRNNCVMPLGATYYKPQETYVTRLTFNLEALIKHSSDALLLPPSSSSSDPLVAQFHQITLRSLNSLGQRILRTLDPQYLLTVFRAVPHLLQNPRFVLSDWQICVRPLTEALPALDQALVEVGHFHQECLVMLRSAKESGTLGKRQPENLKQELQAVLFKNAAYLSRVIMILQDSKTLSLGEDTSDIMHLLPESMTHLLELEGFDEIFPMPPSASSSAKVEEPTVDETAASQSALEPMPVVDESAPLIDTASKISETAPSTVVARAQIAAPELPPKPAQTVQSASVLRTAPPPAPKPRSVAPIPTKQEFVQETKRRVIVRMLEQCGFEYDHTGRHPMYQHSSGRSVPVPSSIEARGTRGSIYDIAFGPTDGKRDDQERP